MNKKKIIKRLNELPIPKIEYWVITGSALVLHNIKEETSDIDLGCTTNLINELIKLGYDYKILKDYMIKIVISCFLNFV